MTRPAKYPPAPIPKPDKEPRSIADVHHPMFDRFCKLAEAANVMVSREIGDTAYTSGGDKFVTLTSSGLDGPYKTVRSTEKAWHEYERNFIEYIEGKSVLWWRMIPRIEQPNSKRLDLVHVYSRLFAK